MGTGIRVTAQINSLCNQRFLKATAQITFNNCFVVKGLKVFEGEKGLYVKMPSEKLPVREENEKPEYRDTAFPITKEARQAINDVVLRAYELAKEKLKEVEISAVEDETQADFSEEAEV